MSKRKITFMTLLEDYFETYLPYSRGLSSNTINSYKQSFLLLLRFMLEEKGKKADDIRFSDLNYATLLDFLRVKSSLPGINIFGRTFGSLLLINFLINFKKTVDTKVKMCGRSRY